MGITRTEFLRLVEAFNAEEPAALEYFTQRFHCEEPEALPLLYRWAAPQHPDFVLGYVRWALTNRVAELAVPKAERWNLTMFFSNELSWLKRLCHALNECVFASGAAGDPPPLARPLAQALVKRCLLAWAADPALALRSIQLVLPWAKVTLRMLRVACACGERNAIMPLFSCWANRIQLCHELPLPQCPEYAKLDLRFSARVTPQDWQLLAERLGLVPSNALLLSSLEVGNIRLAAALISEGWPVQFQGPDEAKSFCQRALVAGIPEQLFCELLRGQALASACRPWLCELLLQVNRPELLLRLWQCLGEADLRRIEQRVLHETATGSEAWLVDAERCGLLAQLMERRANSAFVRQINTAVRQNGNLSKYFY